MKIDTLEPDVKAIVETILAETSAATGLTWVCVQGRRTMSEQADLYAKGRTTRGPKVTNAPPGSSAHNYGLAADCAPLMRGTKHSIWWEAPAAAWAGSPPTTGTSSSPGSRPPTSCAPCRP